MGFNLYKSLHKKKSSSMDEAYKYVCLEEDLLQQILRYLLQQVKKKILKAIRSRHNQTNTLGKAKKVTLNRKEECMGGNLKWFLQS